MIRIEQSITSKKESSPPRPIVTLGKRKKIIGHAKIVEETKITPHIPNKRIK
jgi:hypothetical protein